MFIKGEFLQMVFHQNVHKSLFIGGVSFSINIKSSSAHSPNLLEQQPTQSGFLLVGGIKGFQGRLRQFLLYRWGKGNRTMFVLLSTNAWSIISFLIYTPPPKSCFLQPLHWQTFGTRSTSDRQTFDATNVGNDKRRKTRAKSRKINPVKCINIRGGLLFTNNKTWSDKKWSLYILQGVNGDCL